MTIKQRINNARVNFRVWMSKYYLWAGAYLLKKGALFQPGNKITLPAGLGPALNGNYKVVRKSAQTVWIRNMFYDFVHHKITYSFSDKPIKPVSAKPVHESKG